jgi:hypothetical protein
MVVELMKSAAKPVLKEGGLLDQNNYQTGAAV